MEELENVHLEAIAQTRPRREGGVDVFVRHALEEARRHAAAVRGRILFTWRSCRTVAARREM